MANATDAADLHPFDASDYHVGIAVGLFNGHITIPMKELALKTLTEDYKVKKEHIHILEVAGAADMPVMLEALARKEEIDCLVSIAAIIRGATAHFEYVAKIATEAVKDVQLKHMKPVAFGILTVDTEAQAKDRIEHAIGYTAAALHAAKNIKELS
ncbi:6,7-dimethyl-8-ribityllumazine synthase [Candidatus Pacebacteria bacterium]|nr:6,7-dimethyl-8-ribityllumazine synthase [Candidatus Paceibacterota bacterium]